MYGIGLHARQVDEEQAVLFIFEHIHVGAQAWDKGVFGRRIWDLCNGVGEGHGYIENTVFKGGY